MAERVVAAQRQSAELLCHAGLQSGIAAVGIRCETRSRCRIAGRAAAGTDKAQSIRRRQSGSRSAPPGTAHARRACPHSRSAPPHARPACCSIPRVVLVVVRRLERAAGKGIQAHRQRARRRARGNSRAGRRARAEDRLKTPVRIRWSHPPRCPLTPAQSPRRPPARRCRPQTSAHKERWLPPDPQSAPE